MDVGNKTLSQLSDEAKEKRYVALDVGAKVSGYTKEYLERLCRLNKVEYRVWNNGQFVIELESLLRETHTILLSYEDIMFVDKATLADPTAQIVTEVLLSMARKPYASTGAGLATSEANKILSQKTTDGITQSVPNFGAVNRAPVTAETPSAFSFVGRAVVSDPLHPVSAKEQETHIPIATNTESVMPAIPHKNISSGVSLHIPISGASASSATPLPTNAVSETPSSPQKAAVHLSVMRDREETISPTLSSEVQEFDIQQKSLSVEAAPQAPSPGALSAFHAAAPELHPIATSIDATMHHDEAPLFPFTEKILTIPTPPTPSSANAPAAFPSIPDLGPNKRVVVFAPAQVVSPPVPSAEVANAPIPALPVSPATHPSVALLFSSEQEGIVPPKTQSLSSSVPTLPRKQVSILPALETSHQLSLRENFALTKSTAFNAAFVLCLFASAYALRPELPTNFLSTPLTYVASVVSAFPENTKTDVYNNEKVPSSQHVTERTESVLPFSDEVRVEAGTTEHSISVIPVFSGADGAQVDYRVLPLSESTTTGKSE